MTRRLRGRVGQGLRALEGAERGLVVAVSGGPDSVALVRLLVLARDPADPPPLVLAHLNHQLRGDESDTDETFVVDLHAALRKAGTPRIDVCRRRLDVGRLARERAANLEAVARQERYNWLAEVARENGMCWVATGHTADDQAETVLHRLLRGTGLQGLRGIAARRELGAGVMLTRPLLTVTRAEILACLAELGQPFRHDRTNDDRRHTRNRIRHELLPLLARDYNPRIAATLSRLAEQADEAFQAEAEQAADLLRAAELPRAGTLLVLDRSRLAATPRRLVRAALRLAWAREGWPLGEMGHGHWERLTGLAFGDGSAADLPGRVSARCRGRVLLVGPAEA